MHTSAATFKAGSRWIHGVGESHRMDCKVNVSDHYRVVSLYQYLPSYIENAHVLIVIEASA